MVTIRSLILRTVWMSWETNTIARLSRSRRSISRLRICARTDTSSAEVGSSATSSPGRSASARAMATRWRWPPDSWLGTACSALLGRPTSDISSRTRSARSAGVPTRCTSSGSRMIRATGSRRFSAVDGSWKTMPTSRPNSRARCPAPIAHREVPR